MPGNAKKGSPDAAPQRRPGEVLSPPHSDAPVGPGQFLPLSSMTSWLVHLPVAERNFAYDMGSAAIRAAFRGQRMDAYRFVDAVIEIILRGRHKR